MNHESKPNSRRTFIRNMALMGGAGTLLAGGAKTMRLGARKNPMESSEVRRSLGYRLTPHIHKYYKKAAS